MEFLGFMLLSLGIALPDVHLQLFRACFFGFHDGIRRPKALLVCSMVLPSSTIYMDDGRSACSFFGAF